MDNIFGGSEERTQVTQVNVPGPTPQEIQLMEQQVQIGERQLAAFERAETQQAEAFEFLREELARLSEPLPPDPVIERIKQMELERLELGGRATEEEKALIGEATRAAEAEGTSEIDRFQEESLRDIRDILAPARGLRPTDTPIAGDAAGRIAQEAMRQKGELSSTMASTRAQAELNFPLARDQLLSSIGQAQQQLAQAGQTFQQSLRESAFNARLAMAAQQTQGGLGLLGVSPAGSSGLQVGAGLRQAAATTSTFGTGTSFNPLQSLSSLAGGVSGLMTGYAATQGKFSYPSLSR